LTGYLLDTHTWIWHLEDNPKLPRGLRNLVNSSTDRCWLSPISVWEVALLDEHNRVELDAPFRQWVADAMTQLPLRSAPVTTEVALYSRDVQLGRRDPADRLLAATALVYDLTLLTVDPNLTEANWLRTRSR
jgi:PIN domain nuclease of toxin-antitoxin system